MKNSQMFVKMSENLRGIFGLTLYICIIYTVSQKTDIVKIAIFSKLVIAHR